MKLYPLTRLFFGIFFLAINVSPLSASSLLVRYPISSANGVAKLDGDVRESVTATPLTPSKQLGGGISRSVLGSTSGDYLTASWPEEDKRHQGKFFEFKITAQSGFELEYDKLEFTLYSLKDKKTQASLGPRFWELRASVDVGGVWNSESAGNIFSGNGGDDRSVQLAFIDMNDYSGSTAKVEIFSTKSLLGKVRTGSTTSFRLYAYGANEGQGGLYNVWNRGTDLLVHGTLHPVDPCDTMPWGSTGSVPLVSPIPEPKNIAILFSWLVLAVVFLRRRC